MISVAEYIGIYGAIVATGVFIWGIVKNRPKIKIEIWGIGDSKKQDYTVTVEIKNFSDYPIKLDSYGFIGNKRVSFRDTNEENNRVSARDHIRFHFLIDDLRWKTKDGIIYLYKFFYVEDRTGKWYKKKIPSYIIEQVALWGENELHEV